MSTDLPIRKSANTNRSMTEFIKQREGRAIAFYYNSAELADPEGKQLNRPRRFTSSSAKNVLQFGRTTQISLTTQTTLAATNPQFAIIRNPILFPVATSSSSSSSTPVIPAGPVWPALPAAPPTGLNSVTEFNDVAVGTTNDIYVVKFNSGGTIQWATRIGGVNSENTSSQVSDSNGNVYVTCFYTVNTTSTGTKIYNSDGTVHSTYNTGITGYSNGFVVKYDTNGMVQLVFRLEGATDIFPYSVQVDSNGNIYLLGCNAGNFTLYNGNGSSYGTITNSTSTRDGFLIKYNSSGTVQWITKFTDPGTNFAISLDVDSTGNVYITGYCNNTITIYNQNGTTFGTITNTTASYDVYIIKYDTSGAPQWFTNITRASTSDSNYINFIKTDSNGNLYIAGYFSSSAITLYNSGGTTFGTITGTSTNDSAYLVKYNSSGAIQWATKVAGTGSDVGNSIAIDSTGNVYFTGYCGASAVVYNKDGTTFTTLSNSGSVDVFLVKYDSTGFVQWCTRLASGSDDLGMSVTLDANNNIGLLGFFSSTTFTIYNKDNTTFGTLSGNGTLEVFVVKYNSDGFAQWSAKMTGPGNESASNISADSNSNLYVSGMYKSNPFTLYSSNGTAFSKTLINQNKSNTTTDGFLTKYYSNGTVHWAVKLGNNTYDDNSYSVQTDSNGNVYYTGAYNVLEVNIYNQDGTLFGTLANSGIQDTFLIKYNSEGIVQWATRIGGTSSQQSYTLAIDINDNIYIGGIYDTATATIYNANGTIFGTLTNSGSTDGFIVKYNSNGIAQWSTKISGSSWDEVYSLATDSIGNLYAGITFNSNPASIYNKDGTVFATVAVNTNADLLVVKYNSNGFVQWYGRITGTGGEYVFSINTDYLDNVCIVGYYGANISIYNQDNSLFTNLANSGGLDAFIVKYNSSGTAQWATKIASSGGEWTYSSSADLSGNQYVLGQYNSANSIIYKKDGTTFATLPTTSGTSDAFLIKYDTNGEIIWYTRIGGGGDERAYAMKCDSFGNLYITGETTGTITIYNRGGTTFGTLANTGARDGFLIKYNLNGIAQWAASITGPGDDFGKALTTDINGNVYIVGDYKSNPVTFNKQGI